MVYLCISNAGQPHQNITLTVAEYAYRDSDDCSSKAGVQLRNI